MKFGSIEGIDKPISQLILGMALLREQESANAICDAFYESGGNAFDTALIYGQGESDAILGNWIRNRGIREKLVVCSKGAHTPHCEPNQIRDQLQQSLDHLKLDCVDAYMLHRDNEEVPVGEFIDILDELLTEGKLKIFGGSNWSIQRIQEANAYAKKNGKQEFTILSNNFSLARMVNPIWKGVMSASDPNSINFLTTSGIANLAWSSQARGFFTERSAPDKLEDEELVNGWYSEDNFERKRRAEQLAQEKGVDAINIATAYVLHQPFNSFCLIGPLTMSEIKSSLLTVEVELTPSEIAWLNLESDKS